jgi:DegV family protein with EDD domain
MVSDTVNFVAVPITITIGEEEFVDIEGLSTELIVEKTKACKTAPKTACPSPESFAEIMRASKDDILVVTISSKLSGTYNSARLAAEMVAEEQPGKKIFVLDSLSACGGLAHILLTLKETAESQDMSFDDLCVYAAELVSNTKTCFALNDLSTLAKSGRMSKVLGVITSVIPIKLICGDDGEGGIKKLKQVLGFKKAIEAIAEYPGEHSKVRGTDMQVVISHCHNEESANIVKTILETKFGLKKIITLLMRGTGTIYANDKGLTLAY